MGELMSIKETAKRMGVTELHLRTGIVQGLYPFGVALNTRGKRKQYKIYKGRFNAWIEGKGIC